LFLLSHISAKLYKINNANIRAKYPEPNCDGHILERISKRGKIFYGCSQYPNCTFATWDKPVNQECPDCGAPYLLEKETKLEGKILKCGDRGCGVKVGV
jgi:DNA topoisomerase I